MTSIRVHPLCLMAACLGALLLAVPAVAQDRSCTGLLFSTEEDFLSGIGGLGVVSDGDLLSRNFPGPGTGLCARNAELLQEFQMRMDLGLDAVYAADAAERIFAFSTELDDPAMRFRAGDLLGTNGAIVPNQALLARFDLPERYDLGLDAVHFRGERRAVVRFLEEARAIGRDGFLDEPDKLFELLEALDLDILFSTEGTAFPPERPSFLDGDLLSALTGTIERSNADLLTPLPAGVPVRGADFGLDAFTFGRDPIEQIDLDFFSSEIDSLERRLPFTDGDLLAGSGSVFLKNIDLTLGLEPPVRELGLDALDLVGVDEPRACTGELLEVNGLQLSLIDAVTGYARKFGGANPPPPPPSGAPFDRPFGAWLVLHGDIDGADCANYEYRIEWQEGGGPWTGLPTPGGWQTNTSPFCSVAGWGPYTSGSQGWIPVSSYLASENCHGDQALQLWSTSGRNGLHRVRLGLRQIGNPASETVGMPVAVTLDNVAPNDVGITLWNAACTAELTNQCEVSGDPSSTSIYLKGRARDDGNAGPASGDEHFYVYSLTWTGGNVGSWQSISVPDAERFYDGGAPQIGNAGTEPPGTDIPLTLFNLSAAYIAATGGTPPPKCGYTIRIVAVDRAILGNVNLGLNWIVGNTLGWRTQRMRSFCFEPSA